MPFSLSSYLLGVGTVVGALAFGFGGGVVLTKTAMKSSPAGETRVERVTRAEPPSSVAPQNADRTGPTPSTPSPTTSVGATVGSAQSNSVEGLNETGAAKPAESTSSVETKAAEPAKKPAEPAANSLGSKERSGESVETKEAERHKTIDRKLLRQKAEAERKAREKAKEIAGRAKPRQFEQVEHSDRSFAFRRQEAQPNFFEAENGPGEGTGLFDQSNRPAEGSAKPAEWNEPERRQMVDRKLTRQQRDGERKRRETAGTTQQRQFEQVEPSSRIFAFERQETRPSLFGSPLFGHSFGDDD